MEDFKEEKYVIGIIKCKDKYLILRFREDYNWCPTDWDFLTKHIVSEKEMKTKEEILLNTLQFHIGLKGNVVKSFPDYSWPDSEYKILWHYYPFIIEVTSTVVDLSPESKYDQYKWISKENILQHDRLGYLKHALSNTLDLV